MWLCSSVCRMEVIAMPSDRFSSSGATTPIKASLLVRTFLPSAGDSAGSPATSACISSNSGKVPITPPAQITRSAVSVSPLFVRTA